MTNERTERLAKTNYWDALIALRDSQRADLKTAVQVVKEAELPLESNRQGLMRWYMHPDISDTVLRTFLFFEQEIPPGSRSGRLKFQGGQVIYVLAGRGHTIMDGVRYPWEEGDIINLPVRRNGIVVQHFNDDLETPVKFVAAEANLFAATTVDRGSGFEQLESAPTYG
jgi:gentisate 1,2-dioxygenase